jgi:plastocyanin
MKSVTVRLVAVCTAALLFAGCPSDKGDPPKTNGTPPANGGKAGNGGKAPNGATPPGNNGQKNGAATNGTDPNGAGDPAVPEKGEPGSIKGRVKSPYTRLAVGVVYIKRVDGVTFQIPKKNAMMDQKNLVFTPHVLPVLVGSSVDFPNSDSVRHNVFSRKGGSQDFNLGTYDAGLVKSVKFEKTGVTHLGCNVHAEMSAYIVVCQNPYFAVMDKKGNFEIPKVPPGKWQLTFFHEKMKAKTVQVVVKPGQEASAEFTGLKRK